MFADHPDAYVEFLGCRYRGKEGIKRLYQGRFQNIFVKGRNGPVYGFLLDHAMMQDIVDVDDSGTHAWVRMRALMSAGTHQSIDETHPRGHVQWWEGGVYENEYLKENGVWKLFRYRYFPFWHGTSAPLFCGCCGLRSASSVRDRLADAYTHALTQVSSRAVGPTPRRIIYRSLQSPTPRILWGRMSCSISRCSGLTRG